MIKRAAVLGLLAVALFACSSGNSGTAAPAALQGEVVGTNGLDVKVAFAAASLGDEGCGGGTSGGFAASCAAPAEGTGQKQAGDSARGGCGGCRATNIQLSFTTSASGGAAKVSVVSVSLIDAASNSEVAALTANGSQTWDATAGQYRAWDGTLTPSAEVKASYTLTSPEWSKLDPSYTKQYKLVITLNVDGTTLLIESEELNREPAVAT
jgi:hypothetical protein